ncbi:hypothetical protein FRC11_014262 [Ceratobasidium sp. 423]|nr:hypothetical protein FRC11_014262 [Ceratobasidium sp. 423]
MYSQKRFNLKEDTPDLRWHTLKEHAFTIEPSADSDVDEFDAGPDAIIEDLVDKVVSCLTRKEQGTLIISRIQRNQAAALDEGLEEAGWKVRLDWDADTNTATIRMPSGLHNTYYEWTHREYHDLSAQLDPLSPCSNQKLSTGGDTKIKFDDGSTCFPDGCFQVLEGDKHNGATRNRVIIESLRSQPVPAAMKKTEKLLLKTNNVVQAVLLIIFKNPPSAKVKAGEDKVCTVTMEVWIRKPTRDEAIDHPLDGCPWSDKGDYSRGEASLDDAAIGSALANEDSAKLNDGNGAQVDEAGAKEDDGDSDSSEHDDAVTDGDYIPSPNEDDDSIFLSNENTRVEDLDNIPSPAPLVDERITQRTEPLLIYSDDPSDAEYLEDTLYLDAYDFFRVCAEKPDEHIPKEKRFIRVQLQSLRDAIAFALGEERRELREKRARLSKPETKSNAAPEVASTAQVRKPIEDLVFPQPKKRRTDK